MRSGGLGRSPGSQFPTIEAAVFLLTGCFIYFAHGLCNSWVLLSRGWRAIALAIGEISRSG
jgi:hypothetical protein